MWWKKSPHEQKDVECNSSGEKPVPPVLPPVRPAVPVPLPVQCIPVSKGNGPSGRIFMKAEWGFVRIEKIPSNKANYADYRCHVQDTSAGAEYSYECSISFVEKVKKLLCELIEYIASLGVNPNTPQTECEVIPTASIEASFEGIICSLSDTRTPYYKNDAMPEITRRIAELVQTTIRMIRVEMVGEKNRNQDRVYFFIDYCNNCWKVYSEEGLDASISYQPEQNYQLAEVKIRHGNIEVIMKAPYLMGDPRVLDLQPCGYDQNHRHIVTLDHKNIYVALDGMDFPFGGERFYYEWSSVIISFMSDDQTVMELHPVFTTKSMGAMQINGWINKSHVSYLPYLCGILGYVHLQ